MKQAIHPMVPTGTQLASGDPQAFGVFYTSYYPMLLTCAQRWSGSKEKAEDAVQEVFAHLWKNVKLLAGVERLKPYVFTAMRNQLSRQFHKTKKECLGQAELISNPGIAHLILPTAQTPVQITERKSTDNTLHCVTNHLGPQQAKIINMYYFEGYTFPQIADEMCHNEEQIRSAACKARKRMAKQLTAIGVDKAAYAI